MKQLSWLSLALMLGMVSIVFLTSRPNTAQTDRDRDMTDYSAVLTVLVDEIVELRQFGGTSLTIIDDIAASGDPLYLAPLIDVAYFVRSLPQIEDQIYAAVAELSGLPTNLSWPDYFTQLSEDNIELPPEYATFKGDLFGSFVDDQFNRFFQPGVQDTAQVNMLEVVWGGVRVDGIPSLVNATQITPDEALGEGLANNRFCNGANCVYPAADELVFGVSLDGDSRAYPLRILNWHEMFNDVIGHTPLLDAPNGEPVCNFRAGSTFDVVARSGEEWVQIVGRSAGCPETGWIAMNAADWGEFVWDDVRPELPDVNADQSPLESSTINASVTGRPVMLAYCTLCGSGILYDATIPDLSYTDLDGNAVDLGETVLEFGSTGMLMRSNKLMYDRLTDTVWNALTGTPAFGPLATSDIQLDLLPVVVTNWSAWLAEHPDTSVLSLDTGVRRDYTNGAAYGHYFNDPDWVMFPVWQQDETLSQNKEMVFGLRFGGEEKAYPLEVLIEESVTNDTVADVEVVIVTRATPERDFFEPGGAAVRAYDSAGMTFTAGDSDNTVLDENGIVWDVTEDALVNENGDTLERLPGHLAFWFGWFSFYPETLFYEGASA